MFRVDPHSAKSRADPAARRAEYPTDAVLGAAHTRAQSAQNKTDAHRDLNRLGAIDLTVTNLKDTDEGYDVLVDGRTEKQKVKSPTCGVLGVSSGLHELAVTATIGGVPAHSSLVISVEAETTVRVALTMAKWKP